MSLDFALTSPSTKTKTSWALVWDPESLNGIQDVKMEEVEILLSLEIHQGASHPPR
jgi:hypothetical protein